eukprot:TRINITY_DN88_c0_g1_i4.p1 TRINITY_DN88_c0_g1~~TRINITY_DN88_c0_g1_i4.p1  ORF type:complete len:402 (+),score=62.37 TRINITY_DN88_c0_g1_i4:195-1400(+)
MDSESNTTTATNASSRTTNTRKRKLSEEFCFNNINVLPSEILVHIFSMTRVKQKRWFEIEEISYKRVIAVSLVCKQWNLLCLEPSLWKHYILTLKQEEYPKDVKKMVNPKFSRIYQLNFHDNRSYLTPHYAHLIFGSQGCSECTSMLAQLSESQRSNLTLIFNSVTKLEFKGYFIQEHIFQGVCTLPKLTDLYIFDPTFHPNISFETVANLTTLKRLFFDFENNADPSRRNLLAYLSKLPYLEELGFFGLPENENANISHLAKLPKLKVLKLESLCNMDQVFFQSLSTLTQIETLFIEYIEDSDFSHTLNQPLPKLTHFTIQAPIPSERFTPFLTPFLPKLEYISVIGEDSVLKEHILEMISLSPFLRTVDLKCMGVSEADLYDLRKLFEGKVTFKNYGRY